VTRRIEPAGKAFVAIVDDLVRIRGGVLHTEWTGKFDGQDYSVQGADVVLTYAVRPIDDRSVDLVQKVDGAVVATIRLAISPDGRVLTTVAPNGAGIATMVYEKS
jgi:hypothetical protein